MQLSQFYIKVTKCKNITCKKLFKNNSRGGTPHLAFVGSAIVNDHILISINENINPKIEDDVVVLIKSQVRGCFVCDFATLLLSPKLA